jgi:hypothetical protein
MLRTVALTWLAWCLLATDGRAQNHDWANKLFSPDGNGNKHDFGSVPRGAQLYHRFPMKNIWAVPIEIVNVRVSCGCVKATPSKATLQKNETAFLDVTMDANKFTGQKSVSIYVQVGPEYISTALLTVSAFSRADVVFNPGHVAFGVVPAGQSPAHTIDVEYAGALDWRVTEIVKSDAPLDATLEETYRRKNANYEVGYRIRVTLKPDVPPGAHKWELLLKTNDLASPHVPVLVEATVQASLSVNPGAVNLGNPKVGELVTRRVVVSGSKPFKITEVEGAGDGIQAELPATAAARQFLTIKCQPAQAGAFKKMLRIKTDLGNEAPVTVTVEGTAEP